MATTSHVRASIFLGSFDFVITLAMFNLLSFFSSPLQRRWFYPLLSLVVALGISVGSPRSQAIPLSNLIFRGVQVIQLSNVSDKQEIQLGNQQRKATNGSKFNVHQMDILFGQRCSFI